MDTNAQVAKRFINREPAQSRSMRSDGRILWSYQTPIAVHQNDGAIRVSSQGHSVTTTQHHAKLWQAAYDAGYRGPASWQGDPNPKRSGKRKDDPEIPTVPFHDDELPARSYARPKPTGVSSYNYGQPRNMSDPDARAVVWQRLSAEEIEEEKRRNREYLNDLLARSAAS